MSFHRLAPGLKRRIDGLRSVYLLGPLSSPNTGIPVPLTFAMARPEPFNRTVAAFSARLCHESPR